jgi:predicted nuclease of predicted toxin-antitoxin system
LKILLDENFPLPLYRRLREAGYDVEHVIALGKRGMPDAELRRRLAAEPILLLTNDTEFEDIGLDYAGKVIISRLPQRLPIAERVEIWFKALQRFLERESPHKLFDLLPDGQIVAWEIREFGRVRASPAGEG